MINYKCLVSVLLI